MLWDVKVSFSAPPQIIMPVSDQKCLAIQKPSTQYICHATINGSKSCTAVISASKSEGLLSPEAIFAAFKSSRWCRRSECLKSVGFSDATRGVWVARSVAWRRRSAQAGNRGVGLGGTAVSMGI
jgi:hypothetical protein